MSFIEISGDFIMVGYFAKYSSIMRNNDINIYNSQELSGKFEILSRLLIEENAKYNLTAIKNEELVLPLHFADCLLGVEYIPDGASVVDVGCGGGFPTLPLAIVREDLNITAMDSTEKKLGFIELVCRELGLKNVKTLAGRAEEYGKTEKYREKFRVACARGVSRLNILSELCMPFVAVGGKFIAMKGAMGEEEYKESAGGIVKLGGGRVDIFHKTLYVNENESQERSFVVVEKVEKTLGLYPRMYSKIKNKPL